MLQLQNQTVHFFKLPFHSANRSLGQPIQDLLADLVFGTSTGIRTRLHMTGQDLSKLTDTGIPCSVVLVSPSALG